MMEIRWVSVGVPPFRTWEMTTKQTPVPRVGDVVKEGSYYYKVLAVCWSYDVNTVFIQVEKTERWEVL